MNSDKVSPPEWDLLLLAAQKNQAERIREMVIDKGVDPNHSNAVGQSALHIASIWANVEAVQALVDCGANTNAKNRLMGSTPLHMTAQSRNANTNEVLQVIDLLLEYGADPSLPDDQGRLPVDYVVDEQSKSALIIEKLQPKKTDLFVAIEANDVERVRQILAADVDCVSGTNRGQTTVGKTVDLLVESVEEHDVSALQGLSSILKLLLECGGKQSGDAAESSDDQTPLDKILEALRQVYKNRGPQSQQQQELQPDTTTTLLEETAHLLIQAGAAITPESMQLLHQAARRNELSMVKFLIEQLDVDPNTAGRQGMTALQFAARSGQMDVLHYLLSLDDDESNNIIINVQAADDRGQTALDAARVNGKEEAVQALEEFLQSHSTKSSSSS